MNQWIGIMMLVIIILSASCAGATQAGPTDPPEIATATIPIHPTSTETPTPPSVWLGHCLKLPWITLEVVVTASQVWKEG